MLWLYFFLATASHGLLDALTNGGLGVAFLSPFDTTRYFFGFRPVAVSPIGVSEFLTAYGAQVLASEARWIWMPSGVLLLSVRLIQRMSPGRRVE
jgi:inner membrane protein